MKFTVDPKIFATFPGVSIGVVVARGINNHGRSEEILKLLRGEESRQKEVLTGVELGSLSEIAAWREIYQKFGSDPRDFRSSVESLLRRARGGGKSLPQINNLVDLYNYLSLKYHLPVGAEDLDNVVGDISLTFADGTEKGITLGSSEEETPYPDEVIYKDTVGFICRRWNWREADRTKIEEGTQNAVVVVEKAPALDQAILEQALTECQTLINQHLGGKCAIMILNDERNEITI